MLGYKANVMVYFNYKQFKVKEVSNELQIGGKLNLSTATKTIGNAHQCKQCSLMECKARLTHNSPSVPHNSPSVPHERQYFTQASTLAK